MSAYDLADAPRGVPRSPSASEHPSSVYDASDADRDAREILWYYLTEIMQAEQAALAEEGWEPVPGTFGPDTLGLKKVTPRSGLGCIVYIILFPLIFIPWIGNFIVDSLSLAATGEDYYVPLNATLPMRRRRMDTAGS